MQFETQSMTSVLYTPPISDYRALRAWLPLAYRNSWNRRFITLRNRYNIVRNKYLRGDKTAFDAMTNMLVQESTNSVISGVYMALVEALCQSFFYDWEDEEYKQEFMGKGFAARAKVEGNSARFLLQAFANIIFANSSIFPGLNESLLYGFNVGMGTPNAQFSANGILTSKIPALSQIARFWDKRVVNYKAFRALAGFIEVLAPIPANQLLNFGAGAVYGYDVMWHYLMDLPIPIINNVFPVDKNGKRIINPDGTYKMNADEDTKFMKQIKDLQNSRKDTDRDMAENLLINYNDLKKYNKNTQRFSDKTVAFADANAIRIAESLFQQRDAIAKLTTAYEAGKRQIAPYLKVEPVVIPGQGSIFFVNGSVSNRLDGDKVLAGLTKIAKVSPDIAKALLKRWSNVRTMSQYVKISNKDNITTGA
jgi:hypothetical protein